MKKKLSQMRNLSSNNSQSGWSTSSSSALGCSLSTSVLPEHCDPGHLFIYYQLVLPCKSEKMDEKCSTHCWAHRKCLQNSLCYARGVVTNGVLLPNSTVGRGCPVWSIALDSWCRCKWSHDIDLEPCSSWERCFTLPQAGLQLSDVGLNKEDKEGDLTINTHLSLAHLPKDWISESLILGNSVFCRSFSKC